MKLRLDVLPKPQRRFWDEVGATIPDDLVLYGGTAIALRFGHRPSVDFDFFTDRPADEARLRRAIPALARAIVLQKAPDTLVVTIPVGGQDIKLSFFGGLSVGRVGDPDKPHDRPALASPLDLLATKLKTLHDRVEARDYLDIEVLLRSGLSLSQGIAAARALFGPTLNPLDTAKAVGWFKDGGLEQALGESTRDYLTLASATFDPAIEAVPIRSRALAPTTP